MAESASKKHPEWERLTKAQDELRMRKSAQELHVEAYEAYRNDDNALAASLFHEAAALAAKEGDPRSQALNLTWEADSLQCDDRFEEALVALGAADQVKVADNELEFSILLYMNDIADMLPLPLKKQQELLDRLAPFKETRRMGDTRSMVLHSESVLLSGRGRWKDALNKSLEAFAEQKDGVPGYDDNVYFNRLVVLYRKNGMASQAWETLRRWREQGSTAFAIATIRQLRQEGILLFDEGHADHAWDVVQRCVAEERQLPNFYGTASETLRIIVTVGCATGRYLAAREAILDHRGLRNSESKWVRYGFRFECARYWCSLLENACTSASDVAPTAVGRSEKELPGFVGSKVKGWFRRGKAKADVPSGRDEDKPPALIARKARNWLGRAEAYAIELDRLLECDVRTQEVAELRKRLQKACATLCLSE